MRIIERPSPNHEPRAAGQPVDMLVLHYTGMPTAEDALARLCDPLAKVSAHWVIDEAGTVWRLVPEDRRAWHAGLACWRGATDVNGRSIGVELVNPGHEWGYRPFPEPQMAALIELARGILARHPIPPANVVGHSDVAPTRKQDPGELFDWPRLARQGVGRWPTTPAPFRPLSGDQARELLAGLGWDVTDMPAALTAFQRHFRPARVDGTLDEQTMRALLDLAAV